MLPKGGPSITLTDEAKKTRVLLVVNDDEPTIGIADNNEDLIWKVPK